MLADAFEVYRARDHYKEGNRKKLFDETRLQLTSAHTKANSIHPLVWEGPVSCVVYAKLHFDKPVYRKIMFLAELYDEPFLKTLMDMIEHELEGELNNTDELGHRIRQRILEAHGLGKETPVGRPEALQKLGEKLQ